MTDLDASARAALDWVRSRSDPGPNLPVEARVALHFHPEADISGTSVLGSILGRGRYLSQFATRTSNGGLTAVAGGNRWLWEQRIFNHAYDRAAAVLRPVYGALDIDGDPYGPAPRFGSAYLCLRPQVLQRTTFAYPDSTYYPISFGVADRMGLLEAYCRDDPRREEPNKGGTDFARDILDYYVEAHVHGGVRVPEDVEAIVLDPSFDDESLLHAARRSGITVETHPGYRVDVGQIAAHPEYRGPEIVEVAKRIASSIAHSNRLSPVDVGRARRCPRFDAQQVKQVWHCLARFGRRW